MDLGLDDKTALVTGGGGRIGSEDCRVLAAEGADVVALDVTEEAAANVAAEINDGDYEGEAHAVACDLTDREDVADTVAALEDEDVANLLAYLCSEQASCVTGQVIGVTGGVDLFSF